MNENLKLLIKKVIHFIIDAAVAAIINGAFDIEEYVSTRLGKTYEGLVFFEAIVIALVMIHISYWSGLIKKIKNFIKPLPSIFKFNLLDYLKVLLSFLIILVFAFAPSILFYFYKSDWWFRLHRFNEGELGILIADFREPSLKQYFPQHKYSNYLKEELPKVRIECGNPLNVKFLETEAFFTSNLEAKRYGLLINASLMYWGEVYKSESYLSIRPRIAPPRSLSFVVDGKHIFDKQLYVKYSENWDLRGILPSVDTVQAYLNEFIVLPTMTFLKDDFDSNGNNLLFYSTCTLQRKNFLPPIFRGVIALTAGVIYFDHGQFDSSLYWSEFALKNFLEENREMEGIDSLISYSHFSMAVNFDSLGEKSKCLEHLIQSVNRCRDFTLRPGIYDRLICLGAHEILRENLNELWNVKKDTVRGDRLLDFYATMEEEFDGKFLLEYDSAFPGRFINCGVRIVRCE